MFAWKVFALILMDFLLMAYGYVVDNEQIDNQSYYGIGEIEELCPNGTFYSYFEYCGEQYNNCCEYLRAWSYLLLVLIFIVLVANFVACFYSIFYFYCVTRRQLSNVKDPLFDSYFISYDNSTPASRMKYNEVRGFNWLFWSSQRRTKGVEE
uniref:Uncharacterized protein n=1 Tax=Plectus sambesii TaxID=2011161 RepID=A0A914VX89_9BILA